MHNNKPVLCLLTAFEFQNSLA